MSLPDDASATRVEHEAEAARANLGKTLERLRDNLKPAHVVEEVMDNARIGAKTVSDQLWSGARRNPIAALLIGSGVALAMGLGGRAASRSRPGNPQAATSEYDRSIRHAAALAAAEDYASLHSDVEGNMLHLSTTRRDLRSSLSRLIEEQPLVLGAVGVAVGAALGAAIPRSEAETRMMGDASHSVRQGAQDMALEQVSNIQSAVRHAADEIKQSASDHGLNVDNLSDLARDVGDKARTAASSVAATPDDMPSPGPAPQHTAS